ncbi:MAG: hypothetical protein FWD17_17025, partial [Polyangiaceae bacterium]|nr:hypothetical protein [Polyangiaceae bacterium]
SAVQQGGLGLTAGEVSRIDAIYGTVASLVAGLLGGVFASWMTLPRALGILGLCLNIPHFTYVFLSQSAAAHHGVDYAVVATAVSVEKFGYSFGFVGNMVYMMQQLAPGRSTMTHYAFATSLMNLMLVPTNMISGPLAEWLGFSTFFLVVMFASIPSAWAAFKAPFPLREDEIKRVGEGENEIVVTVDDPTVLTDSQREVQRLAGRASIYAMLGILVVLIADSNVLGSLRESDPQSSWRLIYFTVLLGFAALKVGLAVLSLRAVRVAREAASRAGDKVYVRNAEGARWATWIALAGSVVVVGLAAVLTF